MNSSSNMPSPISSYEQHRRSMSRQPSCYPETPSLEQPQSAAAPLYQGSMAPPSSTVSPALSSPPSEWSHHAHAPAYSTSQPPDIFSAAFDPFSGFSTSSTTMGSTHSPEAPGLDFCQTPPSSNMASHRGSVSSYAPSDASSQGAYTPRGKPEEAGEWYSAGPHVQSASVAYAQGPTMPSHTEHLYREPASEALYRAQPDGYMADMGDKMGRFDALQPVLPSATRIRKRRQRTTPEEATHECRVCGKLFKRSYNWKSHMETHNPERKYPHPCTHTVGSSPCTKKFQRKTDLDRHVDSVHLRTRNHKCQLCGNRFARRDTLRRHTEDGCPKRFELNLREQHAAAPAEPSSAGRWSYPTPSTAGFSTRDRTFSTAGMAPPQAMHAGATFGGFAPAPTAVYSN